MVVAQRKERELTPFGALMRKYREKRNLKLKHVADYLNVSSTYLSATELGRRNPSIEWVKPLQEIYQLSPEETEHLREVLVSSRISDVVYLSHLDDTERKRLVKRLADVIGSWDEAQINELRSLLTHE